MINYSCPLCGSKKYVKISVKSSSEVIHDYKRMFNVDVEKFFPEKTFESLKCVVCDLQSYHTVIPGDSGFYDQMQMHSFYYEPDKPEFVFALEKIMEVSPKRILEIGCGEGLFLQRIKNAYDVSCSEFSEKSIEKLKKAGIRFDEKNDKYDFVMTFQVLEHVSDAHGFLEHAVSKLEEGGYLLVSVPNNDSKYFQTGFTPILDFPPHHVTRWSKKSLENISRRFDLDIIDYYEEPLRIEHLQGMISIRRNIITGNKKTHRLVEKIAKLIDRIILPYAIDKVDYPGLTHAVLMKKR